MHNFLPDASRAAGWVGAGHLEGARRNLALVQCVVHSLGGIPAMVSGELS